MSLFSPDSPVAANHDRGAGPGAGVQPNSYYSPPAQKESWQHWNLFLVTCHPTIFNFSPRAADNEAAPLSVSCKLLCHSNWIVGPISTPRQFLPPNHVIGSRARFEFQGLEPSFNKPSHNSLRTREDSQRKKFFEKFRWERRPSDKHREFIDQLQFPKGNK